MYFLGSGVWTVLVPYFGLGVVPKPACLSLWLHDLKARGTLLLTARLTYVYVCEYIYIYIYVYTSCLQSHYLKARGTLSLTARPIFMCVCIYIA